MSVQSYAGQSNTISIGKRSRNTKQNKGAETLFGLILALTTMYGLGAVLAFLATWLVR
jgi:hypothetical protein